MSTGEAQNGGAAVITAEAYEEQAMTLYERSLDIVVTDQESYGAAGAIIKEAKTIKAGILGWFEPMKKSAKDAWQKIVDKEKDSIKPLDEIIDAASKKQNKFLADEHEKKMAEQRRLEVEERERARKEKERLIREAEALRARGKIEKAEEKEESAANTTAAPVFAESAIEEPVKTTSAAGNVTSFATMETEITVTDLRAFLVEMIKRNMALSMVTIGAGPLKTFIKANRIKTFPGLYIKEVPKARNR